MKKICFVFIAIVFAFSISSCDKCGHCEKGGSVISSTVCKGDDETGGYSYHDEQVECAKNQGVWVVQR